VTITQAEHCVAAASRLSPYLYTIKLSHGPFTWTVKKRYHHFFKLNTSIVVARNKPNFGQNKKVKEDVTDKVSFQKNFQNMFSLVSLEQCLLLSFCVFLTVRFTDLSKLNLTYFNLWWFGFSLSGNFNTFPATLKNIMCFKSGQY
jgi:hypothetical protein